MARSPSTTQTANAQKDRAAGTLPNTDGETLAGRAAAARNEQMVVIPTYNSDGTATGMYRVHTKSGDSYRVFLDQGRCECGAHNRDTKCKHRRRVAIEVTDYGLPTRGEPVGNYITTRLQQLREAFREDLRRHIFGTTRHSEHPSIEAAITRTKRFIKTISDTISDWVADHETENTQASPAQDEQVQTEGAEG